MHLLNRKVAAADAGLVGENIKGNASGDEFVDCIFDARQQLDLIRLADVVDVANERAVAIGKDCELGIAVREAWIEPDVFHVEGD